MAIGVREVPHAATRFVDRRGRLARIALVIVVQRPPGYSRGIGRIKALFLQMAVTRTPKDVVRRFTGELGALRILLQRPAASQKMALAPEPMQVMQPLVALKKCRAAPKKYDWPD